jgi:hypothetical protein
VPRTQPSRADQELIGALALRGVSITATQLERWRSKGYLPRHIRHGLGRGAGSRSEPVAGLRDYVEGLAFRAGQGRSTDEAVLALFMAGFLQPQNTSYANELAATHIASVRRALSKWINSGDRDRDRISRIVDRGTSDPEKALDDAFAEAETISKRRTSKAKVTFDRIGAELGGGRPRTRGEMKAEEEQAYLNAAELRPPNLEHHSNERLFAEIWDTNSIPFDAHIFREECTICASRTERMASSRAGQQEILRAACFCEINRARAIGGAVSMLVAGVRDVALSNPDDPFARAAVQLISNTVFRFLVRDPRKVSPDQPVSIASCTLFFLHDCRWQRSGAATLLQLALWKIDSAGSVSGVAKAARAMDDVLDRASLLRSADGVGMLLALDGILQSEELLLSHSAHCHSSCIDREY